MKYVKQNLERVANKERRRFLDLVTKAGVSTSLLKASPLAMSVFAARHAEAMGNTNKKAIFFYQPDGAPPNRWKPSGSNMNIATAAYGSGNTADGITGYNIANYCSFQEVTNIFSGHGEIFKALGNNTHAGAIKNTLDTHLAKSNGFTSQFSIIRASANRSPGEGGFSVENDQVMDFTEGAKEVYNLLFNGVAAVPEDDNTYKRAFEMNYSALKTIQNKLGATEKNRIEEHITALEKIEKSFDVPPAQDNEEGESACQVNSIASNPSDIVEHGMALADVIVAGLKCGLMNVASIMMSDTQCGWGLSTAAADRMNITSGLNTTDFHSANHGGTSNTQKDDQARMLAYLSQVPAYLISRLVSETDSTGMPLIDSTLMIQFSEMGYGNDHSADGTPWILASGSAMRSNVGSYGGNQQLCQAVPDIMGLRGKISGDIS